MSSISGPTDEDDAHHRRVKSNVVSSLKETKKATKPSNSSSMSSTTTTITSSGGSLKRKKPPQIQIPQVLREVQTDEFKSSDSKVEEDGVDFNGVGVGVFSIKGEKVFMEDAHKIVLGSHRDSKKSLRKIFAANNGVFLGFFGVYDGHGGRKAVEFVAENLHRNILNMLENCGGDTGKEDAVKAGYLKTEQDFLKQGVSSGACCVTALIEGNDIVVSNLGDCRAVLCRGDVAEAITKDHIAGQEDERERIEKKGGYVEIHQGVWRVHGILSVSRSIGDVHMKNWLLAEPDTKILHMTREMEFLVLASNGLWEKNEEKLHPSSGNSTSTPQDSGYVKAFKDITASIPHDFHYQIRLVNNQEAVDTTMCVCVEENKLRATGDLWKKYKDESGSENGPQNSLVKQQKMKTSSPSQGGNSYKTVDKENEDEYACKNASPPSKAQRISLVNQQKMKNQSPSQESNVYKKRPTRGVLVTACKELVNLAVSRGSVDDITVMIIDLKPFHLSGMMQDPIGIPACFSSSEKPTDDPVAITRSGQSVFIYIYRTKIAGQCRLITITWCKNLLLHGLSISIKGPERGNEYSCKVELKPWYFWRKRGSKRFIVDGKAVDIFWDLKAAKFNGETEPQSDYYVAVVCEEKIVLLLGDLKKNAYRKTGSRPALTEPILVSKKEYIFGKKKFSTRVKFHEKGRFHEISIECKNNRSSSGNNSNSNSYGGFDPEMEIKIDGDIAIHVKHLQWKFRGNESIYINKVRVEVYWDVHDWLFCPGLRHALFIFKPISSSTSSSASTSSSLTSLSSQTGSSTSVEGYSAGGSSGFCLFLYAWKVE
ncbi:hypothetical protein HHK36_029553 [Tetracentron sinense]|uniref:protein-serine/threonine phosphatase n=1 Tax=Tetracentron sinense TaxID=13715 RepID=A0A834YBH7_TETSI|nr:hypothetical protein HHK36_029553 [Tetracentron sinense]